MRLVFMLSGLLAMLAAVAVRAETEQGAVEEEVLVIEKKPEAVQIPSTFGTSRIRNWYVLDSKTLIIEVTGRQKYKATLMQNCPGLRFTDSIGFSTMGPYELDRWTTLHLPDGQRCHIKELSRYEEPEKDKP